ncbi:MAG TPA: DUF58 domain-containing protein [Thermomicrobiales bacterium]|jgi:uncharacterized protein (DUF58 family)
MIARAHPRDAVFDEAFLRKLERLDIVARKLRSGIMRGERRSTKRGQSVEFADFRLYSPGDDLRRVDWNVYARTERAFVKLFVEEEDRTVHVLLDVSPSMDWGEESANKLIWGRRAAAAIAYIALAGLDRVSIALIGGAAERHAPTMRGTRSLFRLLDFLGEGATPTTTEMGATDLDSALATYAARARNPGPLFLISDLLVAGGGKAGLAALAAHGHEPRVIHALTPDELDPTLVGELKLVDRESGLARELTVDEAALTRYRRGLANWQTDLAAHCHGRGWPYLPVSTGTPFDEVILNALRRGGMTT